MVLSIDRIEGSFAICIDERQGRHSIPLASLPMGAGEGDILRRTENGYQLEPQETGRRRKAASERLSRLGAASRRSAVSQLLEQATEPVSASALADKFRVSRQIIVGDIALMRASGAPVVATPRGYLLERPAQDSTAQDYTIACRHEHRGRSGRDGAGRHCRTPYLRPAHRPASDQLALRGRPLCQGAHRHRGFSPVAAHGGYPPAHIALPGPRLL